LILSTHGARLTGTVKEADGGRVYPRVVLIPGSLNTEPAWRFLIHAIPGRTRTFCGKPTAREWPFVLKKALPRVWNPNDSTFPSSAPFLQGSGWSEATTTGHATGHIISVLELAVSHTPYCVAREPTPGAPFHAEKISNL
jgi:hypothetical protein